MPDARVEVEADHAAEVPTHVVLAHPVFARVAGISFRQSATDRTPVMVVPFGGRDAAVPLAGICREFGIGETSPDGRMLALIAESLGYVTTLHPGDPLPPEATNGNAGWTASVIYRHRAATRLRLSLLRWLKPEALLEAGGEARCAELLDRDPELRSMVQKAFRTAAERLGLASSEELVTRVEELAGEFAYVEELREKLLQRVKMVTVRGSKVQKDFARLDGARADALARMLKLNGTAIGHLQERFDFMDAQVDDIIGLLSNPENQIAFIRTNRNTLHRNRLGWEKLLVRWDVLELNDDTLLWGVIFDTYQFLCQRLLPATEWPSFNSLRSAPGEKKRPVMSW